MRFKIFSVMLAVIAAAGISANAAELYISSDTTDMYDEYNMVVSETFGELHNYKNCDKWNINGIHSFSKEGMKFGMDELMGSIMYDDVLSDSYVIRTKLFRDYQNGVRIVFGYKDESNYLYFESNNNRDNPDFAEYNARIVRVSDNETEVLATGNLEDNITCIFTEFEIEVKDSKISVSYALFEKKQIFENIPAQNTSGRTGIRFMASPGVIRTFDVFNLNENCSDNVIEGCIVSYENTGNCKIIAAFYEDNGTLLGVHMNDVNVTDCGKNYFDLTVSGNDKYIGAKRKYFLFESMGSLVPLTAADENSSYRENGFSDELEPYYPHLTAETLSADEINEKITVGENPSDEVWRAERNSIIELYKAAGIDISVDMENWMNSAFMIGNSPKTFSRLTPKSLVGDYEQTFSVDAPWNNKIPKDNPSIPLETWNSKNYKVQLSTVNSQNHPVGNGQGIPVVIGKKDDNQYTLMSKSGVDGVKKGYTFKASSDYAEYINHNTTGDRHVIFIDDETKTSFQAIGFCENEYFGGYAIDTGRYPYFDTRAAAATYDIDLTGIGTDGYAGTNAAGVPLNAFLIKSHELIGDEDIEHALAGSLNNMMKARVYPAVAMDFWVSIAEDNANLTGNIPYGAIVRLSPELPLEELYNNKKLSKSAYKVLKAWRDYGFYNIDAGAGVDSLVMYTSTKSSDWVCDVPYNGGMEVTDVEVEITALLSGNEFFGIEKPKFYLTVPVTKHTNLDVNADAEINEKDIIQLGYNFSPKVTVSNYRYDVNKDKVIDEADMQVIENYLNNSVQHTYKTVSVKGLSSNGGFVSVSNTSVREGQFVQIAAIADNGYRFIGWEGEFANYTENVIRFIPDRDYEISAVFAKNPDCSLNITVEGNGSVFSTDTKWGYIDAPQSTYGQNTLLALKAVPDEGYIFSHWEGDVESSCDIIDLLITEDTALKAVFKQVDFYEDFSAQTASDSWEKVLGEASGAQFFENHVGFTIWSNINDIILAKDSVLESGDGFDMTLRGRLNATGIGTGNKGIAVFGYKDEEFYCIDFASDAHFRLLKYCDGEYTVLKDFGILEKINPTSQLYIHADYTPSDGLSITVSQGIQNYKLLQNDTSLISGELSGRFGMGSIVLASVVYDRFLLDIK